MSLIKSASLILQHTSRLFVVRRNVFLAFVSHGECDGLGAIQRYFIGQQLLGQNTAVFSYEIAEKGSVPTLPQ